MEGFDIAPYLLELPILGVFVYIVFKLTDRHEASLKDTQKQFSEELTAERDSRAKNAERLDATLGVLTSNVQSLTHVVNEMRQDTTRPH